MNTLKDLQFRIMSMYSWAINDQRQKEEYKEYMLLNRVSKQVEYYRTHFFN